MILIKKKRFPVLQILTVGILPSFLKKAVYRIKGYKIGKNVKIGFGSVILGKNVSLERGVSIGFFTIVKADEIKLDRFVKIGAFSYVDTTKLVIGEDSRVNEQVYIGGIKDIDSELIIGKRVIIMQMSFINPTKSISIGDDSGIGGDCLLFTHGSWNSILENYPVEFAPIKIGKNVWLPWRVFIAPGVSIGDGAIIGANSFVNKSVESYSLAAGSPAKELKTNLNTHQPIEKKNEILGSILQKFKKYLEHHGFEVDGLDSGDLVECFEINNSKAAYFLCFKKQLKPSQKVTSNKKDSVLIMHNEIETNLQDGFSMVVNLHLKERVGTSVIGEELMSYLSRYGIRFNRID